MAKRNPYRTNTGVHIEWFTVKRSTIYTLVLSLWELNTILPLTPKRYWGNILL